MKNNLLIFGNPNVGKTTIYNHLTNSNERVSNFDGVTISVKKNQIKNSKNTLTDVPGVYSINSLSKADDISKDILINDSFEGIIDVIDVNNLKKNMYLLIDLLETGKNINVIFNIYDLFEGEINTELIEKKLSIRIFLNNNKNFNNFDSIERFTNNNFKLKYSDIIEESIDQLLNIFNNHNTNTLNKRFFAIQFLKGDDSFIKYFSNIKEARNIKMKLREDVKKNHNGKSINGLIFLNRREFIEDLLSLSYIKVGEKQEMNYLNNHLDKVLLHPIGGFITFAIIMLLIFFISVQGAVLQDAISFIFGYIVDFTRYSLNIINAPEFINSLIINGIYTGVGTVIIFLPQIIILFALLSFLEGIGYFSRVNILFERFFNRIGLSSHSLIPYISGFGCNVLGIMSTRTIKSEKKRLATILSLPFISCSARLPIFVMFGSVFFPNNTAIIITSLYLLGIIIAVIMAFIIDKIILKDKSEGYIYTLPKYRHVKPKYILKMTRLKIKSFLKKAGFLILIGSIIVWGLVYLGPDGFTTNIENSFMYLLANKISLALVPLGFGTIEAFSSLLAAFFAKELALSSMAIMYGVDSLDMLPDALSEHFNAAQAYSYMVFSLLYIPCIATLGSIYTETKKIKYVIFSITISLLLGYVISFTIYHLILFL